MKIDFVNTLKIILLIFIFILYYTCPVVSKFDPIPITDGIFLLRNEIVLFSFLKKQYNYFSILII